MIHTITFDGITSFIIPCIFNNLITVLILYQFMRTFLGYTPERRKLSLVLYVLFFILETILKFGFKLYIIPYYMHKYFNLSLYVILFIIIIFIAFCYKPTVSTAFSSSALTALSLYCSVPMANYVFDAIYQLAVPNSDIFHNAVAFRHIFYIIFEEYQQVFIYLLEIIIKLLFLFAVLRVKHIYNERNMYYLQASRQEKNSLELKQFRHDIKNHMSALNQMLTANEEDKALAYLSKLNGIMDSSQQFSHTGNVALDSIVNYKLSEAEKLNITCTFHASIPQQLNIREEDIIIILGNLLDNAIEACLKLDTKRNIHLILSYNRGIFFISVKNSYNGFLKKNGNNNFTTSKKDTSIHGIGLKNVRNTLSHYDGTMKFKTTDTKFEICVIMYINPNRM